MAVIVCDLCNTIADINTVLEESFCMKRPEGEYLFPGATEEYFLRNLWIFSKAHAFNGAAEALHRISQKYDLIFLTARPILSTKITEAWIREHCFPNAPIVYRKDKAAAARELGAIKAIEDSPAEIQNFIAAGIPVMVHKQDYNQNYGNRFSWEEFL